MANPSGDIQFPVQSPDPEKVFGLEPSDQVDIQKIADAAVGEPVTRAQVAEYLLKIIASRPPEIYGSSSNEQIETYGGQYDRVWYTHVYRQASDTTHADATGKHEIVRSHLNVQPERTVLDIPGSHINILYKNGIPTALLVKWYESVGASEDETEIVRGLPLLPDTMLRKLLLFLQQNIEKDQNGPSRCIYIELAADATPTNIYVACWNNFFAPQMTGESIRDLIDYHKDKHMPWDRGNKVVRAYSRHVNIFPFGRNNDKFLFKGHNITPGIYVDPTFLIYQHEILSLMLALLQRYEPLEVGDNA